MTGMQWGEIPCLQSLVAGPELMTKSEEGAWTTMKIRAQSGA
jgi:hypothetical protein